MRAANMETFWQDPIKRHFHEQLAGLSFKSDPRRHHCCLEHTLPACQRLGCILGFTFSLNVTSGQARRSEHRTQNMLSQCEKSLHCSLLQEGCGDAPRLRDQGPTRSCSSPCGVLFSPSLLLCLNTGTHIPFICFNQNNDTVPINIILQNTLVLGSRTYFK